jgi:hypothetical protein
MAKDKFQIEFYVFVIHWYRLSNENEKEWVEHVGLIRKQKFQAEL